MCFFNLCRIFLPSSRLVMITKVNIPNSDAVPSFTCCANAAVVPCVCCSPFTLSFVSILAACYQLHRILFDRLLCSLIVCYVLCSVVLSVAVLSCCVEVTH
mmetsp:Transcript_23849/g.47008  ORF Transcript_23849/g.47008 Transcript_23849/m.47008 type:complete len:101 (+) Transcript_23849:118-420(+)